MGDKGGGEKKERKRERGRQVDELRLNGERGPENQRKSRMGGEDKVGELVRLSFFYFFIYLS